MYTVYHMMSLDDFTWGLERTAQHRRDSHPCLYALPQEGLWHKDSLIHQGHLLSRWVSARAKVSSNEYCEETNTRGKRPGV